jgi:putative Mg2+ transporter-C (MgtC) family protein
MSWLFESWHLLLPWPCSAVLCVFVAAICGGWVGIERERKEKPAGLRTMSLVSLGSCVFTMVGYAFTSKTGDSGRVAAQIVTGIGFLGGGVLLKGAGGVQGTTTAATIWIVAAMGMSVGAGYVPAGIGLAMTIRGMLSLVGQWEGMLFGGRKTERVNIKFEPANGKTEIKIDCLLEQFGILHKKEQLDGASDGLQHLAVEFQMSTRTSHEFLNALVAMPEVVAIERIGRNEGSQKIAE